MAHELSLGTLQLIRQAGTMTRGELARSLGISLSLVSKVTAGLISLGCIEERVSVDSSNGRPAERLAIRPEAAYCIGLDVDRERHAAVVVSLDGEVVASLVKTFEDNDFSPVFQENLVHEIMRQSGIAREQVLGLGVGVREIVDSVSGTVYRYGDPYIPQINHSTFVIPVRDELVSRLDFPHILVDDIVRALGVAEVHYGLGRGEDNFVYLLVDSGIGIAIMLNGVPFIGGSHIAGEIAHIPIGGHDMVCNCGNTGCLNMVVGVGRVIQKVTQLLNGTTIRSSLRMRDELTIQDVIEASELGDKIALQALIEAGEYMGVALAVVLNLFGPRLVVAGGSLAHSTFFLEAANRQMLLRSLEMAARGVELKLTPLDDLAGARGAATMAINALFTPGEKDIVQLMEKKKLLAS